MYKIKLCTLTAGTVKSNYKRTIKTFAASDNALLFMSLVKGIPACWKQFLFDVLAMVKKLGIPAYPLTWSYVDLR